MPCPAPPWLTQSSWSPAGQLRSTPQFASVFLEGLLLDGASLLSPGAGSVGMQDWDYALRGDPQPRRVAGVIVALPPQSPVPPCVPQEAPEGPSGVQARLSTLVSIR